MHRNAAHLLLGAVLVVAWATVTAGCISREIRDAGEIGTDASGSDASPADSGTDSGPGDSGTDSGTDSGMAIPLLELGQGISGFVSAADGAPVDIYMGPQGGFHMFTSFRMENLDPGDPSLPVSDPANPEIFVSAMNGNGDLLAAQTLRFYFSPVGGEPGVYELVGLTVVLDICCCTVLAGENLTVSVVVTDAAGNSATDMRTWEGTDDLSCSCAFPC